MEKKRDFVPAAEVFAGNPKQIRKKGPRRRGAPKTRRTSPVATIDALAGTITAGPRVTSRSQLDASHLVLQETIRRHIHADSGRSCRLPSGESRWLSHGSLGDVIHGLTSETDLGMFPGVRQLVECLNDQEESAGAQRLLSRTNEPRRDGERGAVIPLCCMEAGRAGTVREVRANARLKFTTVDHRAAESLITGAMTEAASSTSLAQAVAATFGSLVVVAARAAVQRRSRASLTQTAEDARLRQALVAMAMLLSATAKAALVAGLGEGHDQTDSLDGLPSVSAEEIRRGVQSIMSPAVEATIKDDDLRSAWYPIISDYACQMFGRALRGNPGSLDSLRTASHSTSRIKMARAVVSVLLDKPRSLPGAWPRKLLVDLEAGLHRLLTFEQKRLHLWTYIHSAPQVLNLMGSFMDRNTVASLIDQMSCGLWAFAHAMREAPSDAHRILESADARHWLLSLLNVRTRLVVPLRSTAFHQASLAITASERDLPVVFDGCRKTAVARGVPLAPRRVPLFRLPDGKTNIAVDDLHGKVVPIVEAELAHLMDIVLGTVSLVHAGQLEPAEALERFRAGQTNRVHKVIAFLAARGQAGRLDLFGGIRREALRNQVSLAAAHACGAVLGAHKTRMLFLGVVHSGLDVEVDKQDETDDDHENENENDNTLEESNDLDGDDCLLLPSQAVELVGRYSLAHTVPQLASAMLGNRPNTQRRSYDTSDGNVLVARALEHGSYLRRISPAAADALQQLLPTKLGLDSHSTDALLPVVVAVGLTIIDLDPASERLVDLALHCRESSALLDLRFNKAWQPGARNMAAYRRSRTLQQQQQQTVKRAGSGQSTERTRDSLAAAVRLFFFQSGDVNNPSAAATAACNDSLVAPWTTAGLAQDGRVTHVVLAESIRRVTTDRPADARLVAQLLTDRRISPQVVAMVQASVATCGLEVVSVLVLENEAVDLLSGALKQLGNTTAPLASTTNGGDFSRDGLYNNMAALRRTLALAEALQRLSRRVWEAVLNACLQVPVGPDLYSVRLSLAAQAHGIHSLRSTWSGSNSPGLPVVSQLRKQLARAAEQQASATSISRDRLGLPLATVLELTAQHVAKSLYHLLADQATVQSIVSQASTALTTASELNILKVRLAAMAALFIGMGLPHGAALNRATLNRSVVLHRTTGDTTDQARLRWAIVPPLRKTLEAGCRARLWPIPDHLQLTASILVLTARTLDTHTGSLRPIRTAESWLAGFPPSLTFEAAYRLAVRDALHQTAALASASPLEQLALLDAQGVSNHRDAIIRDLAHRHQLALAAGRSADRAPLDTFRELALCSEQAFRTWMDRTALALAGGAVLANVASNQAAPSTKEAFSPAHRLANRRVGQTPPS